MRLRGKGALVPKRSSVFMVDVDVAAGRPLLSVRFTPPYGEPWRNRSVTVSSACLVCGSAAKRHDMQAIESAKLGRGVVHGICYENWRAD